MIFGQLKSCGKAVVIATIANDATEGLQRHDASLHGGLDGISPASNSQNGGGGGHGVSIIAGNTHGNTDGLGHSLHEGSELVGHGLSRAVAHGDRSRTRLGSGGQDSGEEGRLGTGGIHGAELHVSAKGLGLSHGGRYPLDHLGRLLVGVILHAHGGHGCLNAKSGMLGNGDRLNGLLKALSRHAHRYRQGASPCKGRSSTDEQDVRLGVLNGGQLNDVHLQLLQLTADLDLFLKAKGAVFTAQGTVGNSHGESPCVFGFISRKTKTSDVQSTSEDEIHSRYHLGYLKRDHLIRAHQLLCLVTGQTGETYFVSVGSLCSGMRLASPSVSARTNRRFSESRTGKELIPSLHFCDVVYYSTLSPVCQEFLQYFRGFFNKLKSD